MSTSSAVLPSVIVLGGGISGLAAASGLVKSGRFNVTLLEGADRLGGRVHSIKLGDYVVEEGAEWVHGETGNNIFQLANPFGLLRVNQDDIKKFGENEIFVTQRGVILDSSVKHRVESFLEKLNSGEDIPDKKEKFGKFAIGLFQKENEDNPMVEGKAIQSGLLNWIHLLECNIEGMDNWFQQSCEGHFQYKSCEGSSQISWQRPNCYNSVFNIIIKDEPGKDPLETSLPNWIHLRKKVTEIRYDEINDNPVEIQCEDGSRYTADHAICTFSLGVLKTDMNALFKPNLPQEKTDIIQNLGFGAVNKIFLEFETPWWSSEIDGLNLIWDDCEEVINPMDSHSADKLLEEIDGIPIWCRGILGFYANDNHSGILLAWAMGPVARLIETLKEDYMAQSLNKVLKQFVGGIYPIQPIVRVTKSNWFRNPLTRGSYSFRSIECEAKNLRANRLEDPIRNLDGKPILCFAGEATHPTYFSAVHGAHDTGIREATRLIDFHQGKPTQ